MSGFVHLHTHTEYSLFDGISRIPELISVTGDLGMNAVAITDHGTLHGVVDFYSGCRDAGIKPIIGCEVYVAHGSRHTKDPSEKSPDHLVLLAQNNEGYRNLMQMVTKSHLEGFYHRPRVDRELLETHGSGLICLSGCASAEVPRLLADGMDAEATQAIGWYQELFGDRYYLEMQKHSGVEGLDRINDGLVKLHRNTGTPLVMTNDAHYVRRDQSDLQDIYLAIQTGTTLGEAGRIRMEDDSYYLKSNQEMEDAFQDLSPSLRREAIANTAAIASRCDVSLQFGQTHLPRYDTPDGMDADQYLAQLCDKGFEEKYPNPSAEALNRLTYEMEVIRHTRFANYFLVVWDIIQFVREKRILFGVRGSAAASVVLHCLGITDIDPLKYQLVFERFLNMERKEMPDIDMDFQDDRRDEVLHYVIGKYGSDRVAQIITFGTMGAKGSIKDVGRALGMSYGETDRIARMVPLKAKTLEDAIRVNPELKTAYDSEEKTRKLLDKAQGLEGTVRQISTHAAGVLIADEPLANTVPLQRPAKGDENSPVMMTQFSMDPVAQLGLLKMDFLGLTSLTILDRTIKGLAQTTGLNMTLDEIPLDDPETFALLSSGNTTDVFQLESSGMQRYIEKLKPSNINDIAAMIALYRPGPMENIDQFIDSKHGRAEVTYPHPSFKELLDETYGVIVYQDQVLFILQQFAGYSLGGADIVRKAMGKKIPALMAKERTSFVDGAKGQGYDEELAREIFDLIEPFAGYAFNKAHSVSYALISYWTAWFKTHHKLHYMAAVLNSRLDNTPRTVTAMNECLRLGIGIAPPDVSRSETGFVIDQDAEGTDCLRVGLSAIKNVGENAIRPIVNEVAKNGPYESLEDFCARPGTNGLNKRTMESLIKAGALDSLGKRGSLLEAIEQITGTAQRMAQTRGRGQTSLFEMNTPAGTEQQTEKIQLPDTDVGDREKAAWERELLGMAVGHNPLTALSRGNPTGAIISKDSITEDMDTRQIKVLGIVQTATHRTTKDGRPFKVVSLEMLGGIMEMTVWQECLEKTRTLWESGKTILATARVRVRTDQPELNCDSAVETTADGSPMESPMEASEQPVREGTEGRNQQPEPWAPGDDDPPETPQPRAQARKEHEPQEPAAARQEPSTDAQETDSTPDDDLRTVTIRLMETRDAQADIAQLREILGTLLSHPGRDRVNLEIQGESKTTLMDFPVISTAYDDALRLELETELGQNCLRIREAANVS